jgi:hypothetical protein
MKGGMTMIPASILTVVTAVVCKKVLDIVFDEPSSKAPYDSIKNHDTLCEDIVLDMIRQDIKEAEQKEGEEE